MSDPAVQTKPTALSVSQMLHLMRLEADRALHHGYPITCLMLGLDGFKSEEDKPLVRAVMPALFKALKTLTLANSVRGLGLTKESLIVAVFPHVDPQVVHHLAQELVGQIGDGIELPGELEELEITISIGLGHNMHPDPVTFQTLLEEAETGLNLAQRGGGDRVVQWKDVESEIDALRDEIVAQIAEIESKQLAVDNEQVAFEERWGAELLESVIELFSAEKDKSAGVVRLNKRVIELIADELERLRDSSTVREFAEQQREITMLERRIRKLTGHLSSTEAELKRVAAMKVVDGGIASIYDSVQGLSSDDDNAEQKKGMLTTIFEANLALRVESANGSA